MRRVNLPAVHYGKAVEFARAGHLEQAADELDKTVALVPNLYFPNALLGEVRTRDRKSHRGNFAGGKGVRARSGFR